MATARHLNKVTSTTTCFSNLLLLRSLFLFNNNNYCKLLGISKKKKSIMSSDESHVIKEGKAEIIVADKKVFYNPVQEFNRDLSIAVLSLFSSERDKPDSNIRKSSKFKKENPENPTEKKGIVILEALSATGLRGIRYAKEIEAVNKIICNDISAKAVETIKRNIAHNSVDEIVEASHGDASMVMYQHKEDKFDAIDLDPYGCPSIFLDAAVQSVKEGGLLLVTATDMAVLAGNSPESCYVKYGAISLKSKGCHEFSLRIVLQNVASHAARYGRYIVPVLSVSIDFYVRVFVKIYSSQLKCKENTSLLGMVYQCSGCETFTTQPLGLTVARGNGNNHAFKLPAAPTVDQLCKHCGHKHHIGGPIWLGQLHDVEFVKRVMSKAETLNLGTIKRITGVLTVVTEELDVPLYYSVDRLMSMVRCTMPPILSFRSAVLNAGYSVSYSHAHKSSVKTDAPNDVIWDIVRAWEKDNPTKSGREDKNSVAYAILSKESTTHVSFEYNSSSNPNSRAMNLTRFQQNPTAYWGPGSRSETRLETGWAPNPKREKNQNKNRHKKNNDNESSSKEDQVEIEPPTKQSKTDEQL